MWGVLIGLGGFLAGILVLALKDWLTARAKQLLDLLYGRFAGSRLLRRRALANYTRELYERHREFPVSFQADEALKLPMESVYVPLRGGPDRTEVATTLRRARRSVVLGAPGAGKTLLLRHESWAWARQRVESEGVGDGRAVPVLLDLHRLNLDPEIGLEQHVVRHFARHRFPGAGSWVSAALGRGDVALYFDGLDEVATDLRPRVVELIKEFTETHRKCRVVVTCRAAVYEGQFVDFDQTLRIQDFDEHLIRRFLGGWPWQAGDVDQLVGALRDTPQIMQLARNPLLLTLIAYLYDFKYAESGEALPHTRAEFYRQVVDDLFRRRESAFPRPLKKAVLQRLALTAQDVPAGTRDRLALPEGEVLKVVRAVLEEQGREVGLADAVLREIVERSGLLLAVDGGDRYQFAHLTLQEYLAAVALREDAEGLIRRYEADPGVWRETVRLWCGVVGRDCTAVVRRVHARDAVLGFLCLADAERLEEGFEREVLAEFKGRLRAGEAGDEVVAAFGLVAGDRRRGELFGFLVAQARSGNRAAAAALAATNLPRAAQELAGMRRQLGDTAWTALGTMGDLAVPYFERSARHYDSAVHMLWRIRTPKAALALNRCLWEASDSDATIPYHLGELLTVPEIADALHTAPTDEDKPILPWVWRPFAHGPDDSLIRIAGRIAYVLEAALPYGVPEDFPAPDPRITAAITVIGVSVLPEVRVPDEVAEDVAGLAGPALFFLADGPRLGVKTSQFAEQIEERHLSGPTQAQALDISMALLAAAGLDPDLRGFLQLLPPSLRLRACLALLHAKEPASHATWDVPPSNARHDTPYRKAMSPALYATLLMWFALSALAAWHAMTTAWGPQWLGWTVTGVIGLGWLGILSMPFMEEPSAIWSGSVFYALLSMAPAVGLYAYLAALHPWGVVSATTCTAAVLAVLLPTGARAYRHDMRAYAHSHPVRRLVLDPLRELP
ncbi:NACHT domain-containing protein [Streptomyces sp. NPDC046909]|uniref:NACHT domain-containing protein n=1 Tax=Streptomyces sp. NPDC046909 TaxID=3155617 RepID=UPI0033C07FF6